jgi:murein DD-endopeptidase MepM/ murein hydrolase activator NlpD
VKKFMLAIFVAVVLGIASIVGINVIGASSSDAYANNCATTPGVLPGAVPDPYNSIFTAASAQWKIDPALEAAIFESEHANTWPNANGPWDTSSAGAMGPFQFMPGTWAGYSSSNPQHPNGNPLDLTDAAYAAAHYLSVLGGSVNMSAGDPAHPAPGTVAWVAGSYNGGKPLVGNSQNDPYRANAVARYLEFKGGTTGGDTLSQPALVGGNPAIQGSNPGCAPVGGIVLSPNGYTNPFPVRPTITRAIDQGVDYSVPVGTPLRVMGNAKVLGVLSNWYSGQPYIWYQLIGGSLDKKCIYYAEQITGVRGVSASNSAATAALRAEIGQTLPAGRTIGYFATAGTSLEFGFADCASGSTLARVTGGYQENSSTAAGVSFNKLMVALGVPSDSPYPNVIGSVAGMGYP